MLEVSLTASILYHFRWPWFSWGSEGPQKLKPVGFIFSGASQLIRMKCQAHSDWDENVGFSLAITMQSLKAISLKLSESLPAFLVISLIKQISLYSDISMTLCLLWFASKAHQILSWSAFYHCIEFGDQCFSTVIKFEQCCRFPADCHLEGLVYRNHHFWCQSSHSYVDDS